MRKTLRNRKALSPVVASIILIAVTVAVSIAVAAWMGALTITFMASEELKITSMTFTEPATGNKIITLAVHNTGTASVTVASAKVNGVAAAVEGTTDELTFPAGDTGSITVTYDWTAGDKYRVQLLSSKGTPVSAYEATAEPEPEPEPPE